MPINSDPYLQNAGAAPVGEAASGLQQAIDFIEKRRDDFMREVGVYDHTTGAVDMSDAAHETVGEWDELIDAFRAMIAARRGDEPGEVERTAEAIAHRVAGEGDRNWSFDRFQAAYAAALAALTGEAGR